MSTGVDSESSKTSKMQPFIKQSTISRKAPSQMFFRALNAPLSQVTVWQLDYICHKVTHFMSLFFFCTLYKYHKTSGLFYVYKRYRKRSAAWNALIHFQTC